jgi:ankyrin repeat protein
MLRLSTRTLIFLLCLPVAAVAAGRTVPLVDAAREGDERAIRALLQQRVDVNAAEADGTTALHWAAHRGDLAAVDLLLASGARAAAVNSFGVAPLALAAANGNAAVVARLLKSGADPNTAVKNGETVLMTAARAGRTEVVRALIAAGANVNAYEDARGQTALMWAAVEGHGDVVRLLVQNGADIKAVSHAPSSPLEVTDGPIGASIYHRRTPQVYVFTPLQFAAYGGHVDAVKALLDAGASLADETPQNIDVLSLAIANMHFDAAALLIERGANIHADHAGFTPLHQVVRVRTLDIGQFPWPQSNDHLTSLDLAKILLAHGASIEARTTKPFHDGFMAALAVGGTPFLMAAKGADVEMMRFLAANGADVNTWDSKGTNAIMAAAGVEMTNPNEDSGSDADSLEALKLAIALGAGDINAVNNEGDTAVHGAVWRQTTDNIRVLAENGAKLDVRNRRGKMALEDARNGLPGYNNSRRTPKPEAAKILYELMIARGLTPPDPNVDVNRYKFGVVEK